MATTPTLRERRQAAGLSLRDVAGFAELNPGIVSLLEQGRLFPPMDQLMRYMAVLDAFERDPRHRGPAPWLTDEEREARRQARRAVTRAIAKGELERQPCETCGAEPAVAHHRHGYTDPLRVVWLCGHHHGNEHAAMNRERQDQANIDRATRRRRAGTAGSRPGGPTNGEAQHRASAQ